MPTKTTPAVRVKFLRLHLSEENIKLYIDLLKEIKMPFTLEISNYTTRLRSENYNVYFLKTEQSNRAFAAAAMIKSDLKKCRPPKIDMNKNTYYDSNIKQEFYSDRAFNIDLKSAYATILFNAGYISLKTYNYVLALPKLSRLAAVGMCASRKSIFVHNSQGRIISHTENINPLSPFFFYCVQQTENIIKDLRNKIFGEMFLFSWVDSIYYLNENDSYKNVTLQYLREEYNLQATYKELENFECKLRNDFLKITFTETESKKQKYFSIPLPETKFKRQLINYLMKKDYNTLKTKQL